MSPAGPIGRALDADVAVIGGGLAGLATATHLARRGGRVLCFEPHPWPRPAVGESLEFSAPKLLGDLGLEIPAGRAPHLYPKTSVRIVGPDDEFTVWPPTWFARPPISCSRLAYHTDRTALDSEMLEVARDAGVTVVHERITEVGHDDDRVTVLSTDRETQVTASWYVDASGHNARVLGRALGLDRDLHGGARMAYWARIDRPPEGHATTLRFADPSTDDLVWTWEIPLNDDEISVGVVMSTARATGLRAEGLGPREILERQLSIAPGLRRAVGEHPDVELRTTTYTPFRHRRTVGPNWVLVGDAAAMVDPLTSNGVTSALRHAEGAARVVSSDLAGGRHRRRDTWMYEHTAPANVATLDRAIEAFLYGPGFRRRFGLRGAVNLYAGTGVVTNSLYARADPVTPVRAVVCAAVLAASRAWIRVAALVLPRLVAARRRVPDSGAAVAVRVAGS